MNIEEGEELQPFQPFGMVEDVKYVSTLCDNLKPY